jgi:hypothetical protein
MEVAMASAISSTPTDIATPYQAGLWLSSNHRHIRLAPRTAANIARLLQLCSKALPGRFERDTWIRYRIALPPLDAKAPTPPVQLTQITESFITHLSSSPYRNQDQVQTSIRFWRHGLRGGHIWMQDGKPLCMQWLFSSHDMPLLRRLPEWSGMYPPLPDNCGQVENLLTLPAGFRIPGGAAMPFALAMYRLAAQRGMDQLITHIHQDNTAAHNWAQRAGWTAYGHIRRYRVDLPLLRKNYVYLHDASPPCLSVPATRALHRPAN